VEVQILPSHRDAVGKTRGQKAGDPAYRTFTPEGAPSKLCLGGVFMPLPSPCLQHLRLVQSSYQVPHPLKRVRNDK
jgi:hypothetical protein